MEKKSLERRHLLMALTGNVIFGFSFLFTSQALEVAYPLVFLTMRFFIAFLLLVILKLTGIVKINLKGKNIKSVVLLGILQPVLYFIFETYGIKYSTTSFSGIMISLIPIAAMFMGVIFFREIPGKLQVLFVVMSVLGVIIMTFSGEELAFSAIGLLSLIGAILVEPLYSIHSRKLSGEFTAIERSFVMFAVGSVAFFLMSFTQTGANIKSWITPLTNGTFWISVLFLSVLSSFVAFTFLNKAVEYLSIARVLIFANITTVISVMLGVFVLKESFTPLQGLGVVMAVIGVYGVNRFHK